MVLGAVAGCSPAPEADGGDGYRLVEELRLGVEPTFGQIPDIAPTPDGGVWILDGEAREVVRVDADGAELRRVGGPGDTEDRFQYPRRLQLRNDTLWVEDLGAGRWSAWDAGSGTFLGAYVLPPGVAGGNVGWTARGLMGVVTVREGDRRLRYGVRWRPEDGAFLRVDSLPPPPVPDPVALEATLTRDGRPMTMAFPLPLAHQPSARPLSSGEGWLIVPGGGEYRILETDLEGATRREFGRDYVPVPVPPAERQAAVERLPSDVRSEADRVPDAYPPFERVVEGSDGRLWVVRRAAGGVGEAGAGGEAVEGSEAGAGGATGAAMGVAPSDPPASGAGTRTSLDLFERDGSYLGEVASEVGLEGFWLHHAGPDAVWGVMRDDQGRPVVLRLRLEGGGGR